MRDLKEELYNTLIDMINDIIEKFFSTKEKQDYYINTHIPYLTDKYIEQLDKEKIKRIEKLFKTLYQEDLYIWRMVNFMIQEIFICILDCKNYGHRVFNDDVFIAFNKVANEPKTKEAINAFCIKCYTT